MVPILRIGTNTAQRMDGVAEESLRFSADEIARIENPGSDEQVYGNTDWFDLSFQRCCSYLY